MKAAITNKYLISVIVPIYNVEQYLYKCLDSIINQTYTNLEIILVDDGSTDKSGLIIDEYAKKDKRIIVIHKENGGLSSARNSGLDKATGDYIGFVDSDDFISKYMYEKLITSCINNNADISICGRYEEKPNNQSIGLCPRKNQVFTPTDTLNKLLIWDGLDSAVWDKLFKKSLWDNIRFPIGKTCEDIATTYKVLLKSNSVSFINEPLYHWVTRYNSISHSINIYNVFHYEEITNEILSFILCNYPELIYNAKLFRKVSLVYTIMYITRISHKDYKNNKRRFYSYKKELQVFKRENLLSKGEKTIYYRYIFRLLRLSYYRHKLFNIVNHILD